MYKRYKILVSFFLTLFLLLAFTSPLNPLNGGWTQQFMPDLNQQPIKEILFLDSLTGFTITDNNVGFDTGYVLKTTNSGDNWMIKLKEEKDYSSIRFINQTTGFIAGTFVLYKTTNTGENWFNINIPLMLDYEDVFPLNEDTIWLADDNTLEGGLFKTTNGGTDWEKKLGVTGSGNPNKIYMFNNNIGFTYYLNSLYKTTNGGNNWFPIPGGGFTDIYFIDSLTGWKSNVDMKKTTDGGLNWVTQPMPSGGIIFSSGIAGFSVLSRDTIWGSGGLISNGGVHRRGIIYRTTNGGDNWLFQIPDTSFGIGIIYDIQFLNKNTGWGFGRIANSTPTIYSNIHTTIGGDTTFLTGIQQIGNEVPKQFKLYQNYPNPFNPKTIVSYELQVSSEVKLSVYDIRGKEIMTLVNQKQDAGKYQVDFSGNGLSSGIYFYQILITNEKGGEIYRETKKMILLK